VNHLDVSTEELVPAESAPGAVMFSLLQVAHALEERLEDALETAGLSWPKYGVLSQLAEAKEPVPLSELAEGSRCVRSNMTQLVDRLEADGLVRRVDDPTDRRIVRAAITPLGAERQKDGTRQMARVEAKFAASLPAADRKALRRVLEALK
jgi:DNA-binding MarR family transcriptional regulator